MSLTAICMQVILFIELPVYQITKAGIVMPVKNRLGCFMVNKFFLVICFLGVHRQLLSFKSCFLILTKQRSNMPGILMGSDGIFSLMKFGKELHMHCKKRSC